MLQYNHEPISYFRSPWTQISTTGISAVLPTGSLDTLGARVRSFFQADSGQQILIGAVPFDRSESDCLILPLAITGEAPQQSGLTQPEAGRHWQVRAHPDADTYASMVAKALDAIEDSPVLDKVVLARRLLIETDRPTDPRAIAHRLGRDPSVTAFAVPLPADANDRPRTLVGGTPELLLKKKGRFITSSPLAGSARRRVDASADREAAEALSRSDKNGREHAMVVEAILDSLSPYCDRLDVPERATLHSTAYMWHLGSRIEGRLRDADVSCADLLAQVHPTPAICGFPRNAAQALIQDLEPFDRGFYAGAIGWLDARGDGEWHIALRCGEICGNQITLFAGAGIVAGSDPFAEADETSAKFLALLNALGIGENGRPLIGEEQVA